MKKYIIGIALVACISIGATQVFSVTGQAVINPLYNSQPTPYGTPTWTVKPLTVDGSLGVSITNNVIAVNGTPGVPVSILFSATPQVQNYEQAVVKNDNDTGQFTYTVTAGYRSIFTTLNVYNPPSNGAVTVEIWVNSQTDGTYTIVDGGIFKLKTPFDLDEGQTVDLVCSGPATNVEYFYSAREYKK